jgi:hypothetical protein
MPRHPELTFGVPGPVLDMLTLVGPVTAAPVAPVVPPVTAAAPSRPAVTDKPKITTDLP